jgi:hypothetical protein
MITIFSADSEVEEDSVSVYGLSDGDDIQGRGVFLGKGGDLELSDYYE